MRAVLDTNVLISGLLSPRGSPSQVLRAWLDGRFDLVASPMLLVELRRALAYPKVARRIPHEDAQAFVAVVERAAEVADDPPGPPPVRPDDPGDGYLVALAAARRAILVTGDVGLLRLADRIPVLSPAAFLDLLDRQDG